MSGPIAEKCMNCHNSGNEHDINYEGGGKKRESGKRQGNEHGEGEHGGGEHGEDND